MSRRFNTKTIPPEDVRSSRAGFDIIYDKLELWKQSGLDFCTSCMSERLVLVAGLYETSSYIRCGMCGERQE